MPMAVLWRQCAEWLQKCVPIDPPPQFDRVEDFAAFLKDGVVLCTLANRLANGVIYQPRRNYNAGPSRFVSENNVSNFLKACHETFDIPEDGLFSKDDLTEFADFERVLRTLSVLSRSRHAEELGIQPFPSARNRRPSQPFDLSAEESEVYIALRSNGEDISADRQSVTTFDVYDQSGREEIYQAFVHKPTAHIHKPTEDRSISILSQKYSQFKPQGRREHCLKEMLDTEVNYCETLKMIVEQFYLPMGLILSAENHRAIFLNIFDIYKFHQIFVEKLRRSVLVALGLDSTDDDESLKVPEVFALYKLDFLKYSEYCSFAEMSRAKIAEIEKEQPDVAQKVEEYRMNMPTSTLLSSGNQNANLANILTVPVQRVLKYHLLLKELLEHTTADSDEVRLLDSAYDIMRDVSTFLNEGKRDQENLSLVRAIQWRFVNSPKDDQCEYYGRLIKDGCAKVCLPRDGSRAKQRYVFVFEKILMICKVKSDELKNVFEWSNCSLTDSVQEWSPSRANTLTRKLTNSFFDQTTLMISVKDPVEVNSYVQLIFRNYDERDKWRRVITETIDKNRPARAATLGHNVSFSTFRDPVTCNICHKFLHGVVYQGYHCSNCLQNIHYKCFEHAARCPGPAITTAVRRSHSSAANFVLMRPQRYESGEQVEAMQTVSSHDSAVLSFHQGDLIEVIKDNEDGSLLGRLVGEPGRTGLIVKEMVRRRLGRPSSGDSQNGRLSSGHEMPGSVSSAYRSRASGGFRDRSSANSLSADGFGEPAMLDAEFAGRERSISLVSRNVIDLIEEDDLNVEQYPWFFREVDRDLANNYLYGSDNGTFLVRITNNLQRASSDQSPQFVLHVMFGRVKRMLIKTNDSTQSFYLHQNRQFPTVPALVNYYRENTLLECFVDLDTTLRGTPLRSLHFVAIHRFESPVGSDDSIYLPLEVGDQVDIIDTFGDSKGWWKGRHGDSIGFFPLSYVREKTDEPNSANDSTEFF